jgi:glycosyltransferase involved in cell wall biosynthesis
MGGGETAMIGAAEALRRHFAVSVCALDRRAPPDDAGAAANRPAAQTPGSCGTANGNPLDMRRELRARFDEVTFVTTGDQLQAALAPNAAVIWYGLNSLTPATLASMPRRPRSLRVIHTDKDQEVEHHLRWQHVIDATCCVAPHMTSRIAGATFVPNTCSPDRLRGRRRRLFPPAPLGANGARPRRPTLGWAGRLLPFKNLAWLIERLADLDCNLAIQGVDTDDLTAAQLTALAAERGSAHRLRFLPPSPAVGTLLRSVDAMIVLSLHEGFPMTVVEAGLLGVPVIATRAGALPALFPDDILFVESAHDEPDAAALQRALAALTPDWGTRLRRKVEPLCSPAAVAAPYAARLREILDGHPAECAETHSSQTL